MLGTDTDIQRNVVAGVVTLAGFVDSYTEKWTAEQVAGRVKGVKAIANDIEVRLPSSSQRPDPDIARAAVSALQWSASVPEDRVKVKVEVTGVSNHITVRVRPLPSDIKQKIKDTLRRGAEFDAEHITVDIDGQKVVLRGFVRSYAEMRDAERAVRRRSEAGGLAPPGQRCG